MKNKYWLIFFVIIFVFFSYYSSLNANEIFNLIKIPNLEVFNLDSENKIKYLSLKKSFQCCQDEDL